ncbi:RNase H, putative [Synechococcus sp. PCC 7335]|uniref:ribonuclease HI n=1 Tax=Synechococcus sp. (strain ATCC 29403 / PCC 7335) TaxID=91464 RepID=UPI00017ED61E|nr:ribonuclease HI [Synechococcus sp. PCC 7335]EDX86224.1 RNase H, putative [Synechococcus sp. PCC 7335]
MPNEVKEIYTDGACSGNPGPGGWGTLIEFADGQRHELGGRDAKTTNNRMEMQAAIAALEFLSSNSIDSGAVTLHTDSEYLKNGITKWIKGWKRKGWKTSSGKPVLNKDLWQQLDQLSQTLTTEQINIDWRYVRGHTGNLGNERCDEIARAYAHSQPISLKQVKSVATSSKSPSASQSVGVTDGESVTSDTSTQIFLTEKDPYGAPTLTFDENNQEELGAMAVTASSKKQVAEDLSETSRVNRIRNTLETLQVTDELAKQGYLITSAELADLMDVNASAVTSRGDYWAWRNWSVSRIRREGNQILWQLERIDE